MRALTSSASARRFSIQGLSSMIAASASRAAARWGRTTSTPSWGSTVTRMRRARGERRTEYSMAAVSLGGGAVVAARARRRRKRTVRGIRREPSDLILQPANAVIVGWLRERAHLNPHGRYLPIAHPDLDDVLEALAAGI